MRVFLIFSTIAVFSFSTFSGASIHTLAEVKAENGVFAARLTAMSLRALSEVNI